MWVKKPVQREISPRVTEVIRPPRQVDSPSSEGFVQAARFSNSKGQQLKPAININSFQALSCDADADDRVEVSPMDGETQVVSLGKGVASPTPNG